MKGFVFLLLPLLFGSCDLLRDSCFEVEAWSPGEGPFPAPEKILVSILFSQDPDRAAAEQAFSLTEDGLALGGSFSWEGRRLIFTPAAPLERDRNYLITVLTGASDTQGLSLEKKFEASFTTRPKSVRPKLVSMYPPDEGILVLGRERMELTFSEAVSLNSCIDAITLSPFHAGTWRLTDDEKTAVFTPAEPWTAGTRYRLNISSLFAGKTGLTLGQDFFYHFTVGLDEVPPVLTGAYRLDDPEKPEKTVELFPENWDSSEENTQWERNSRFCLEFSEPIDTASLKKCLEIEPGPSLVMETAPGFADSVVFRFSEDLAHGSRFLIKVNAGVRDQGENESVEAHVFRVYVDGVFSKPPALIGIRLPVHPWKLRDAAEGGLVFPVDEPFAVLRVDEDTLDWTDVDYEVDKPAWLELYFDTAEGAAPDLFSLRELFRVEASNNALSFSPALIAGENFSLPEPHPAWAAYKRLEVRGVLRDSTNSGVINFIIGSGLSDTRGNRNENIFRLPLLK
ncbi:MAG: Ig-like domain-containing protein [Treponema sp.]|jgi:hypothetical protein|nr:Ig-like domain-containing protein [Treponema sp.]